MLILWESCSCEDFFIGIYAVCGWYLHHTTCFALKAPLLFLRKHCKQYIQTYRRSACVFFVRFSAHAIYYYMVFPLSLKALTLFPSANSCQTGYMTIIH
uniref:Uncharacterized protein n=1 Tax=Oryza brachyantha TaxID=4533 RepID=J3L5L7_ORYBR